MECWFFESDGCRPIIDLQVLGIDPAPLSQFPHKCRDAGGCFRVVGNWIQTTPGKGWFTILRLYRPLEPFFTKEWRPSESEEVGAGRRALR
jgi:hypothetical protein